MGGLCQGKQGFYLRWVGAGAPPVCYPWRNRASGIPLPIKIDKWQTKMNESFVPVETTAEF